MVLEKPVEEVWLADKERCDVVVCLTEKVVETGDPPPLKKRRLCVGKTPENNNNETEAKKKTQLNVYTVSNLLLGSLYFETCMKEPWCKMPKKQGSPMQLYLETMLATPRAYLHCIKMLSSSQPCSPRMFTCPLEALDICLASDHLLFKECSMACMDYLAVSTLSSEDRKIIRETFSTSGIAPSKEVAARLGLPKEVALSTLKAALQVYFENYYYGTLPSGDLEDFFVLNNFKKFIYRILRGNGETKLSATRKTVEEFLHEAMTSCQLAMYQPCKLMDTPCVVWMDMMQLVLDTTDGKEAMEAMACKEFQVRFTFILDALSESMTRRERGMIRKLVKILIEMFKRVAGAEVIMPPATRYALVRGWLPRLDAFLADENVCDAEDLRALKGHVNKIVDTLGMDDVNLLIHLISASMNSDYFLREAFDVWCERLE